MEFRCPLIAVEDMAVSRAFYETVLGQEVVLDLGANITFRGGFCATNPLFLGEVSRTV